MLVLYLYFPPTSFRGSPPRTCRQIPFQISPHDSSVWIRTAGAGADTRVLSRVWRVRELVGDRSVR